MSAGKILLTETQIRQMTDNVTKAVIAALAVDINQLMDRIAAIEQRLDGTEEGE